MMAGTSDTRPTDAELVSISLSGDQEGFSSLHDRYSPRLFSYCLGILANPSEAQEAVQSAFVRAFDSLAGLDKPEAFYYWLFTIARNEVYTMIRKKRRNGLHTSLEEEDVWLEDPTHESFVRTELQELVKRHLNLLKPEYREVLILKQFEQLSYAEISAITGNSISSVESRLFKARKALMKHLKPYVDEWRNV